MAAMRTGEVMAALPGRFRPKMAGNMRATIQFDLTGPDGGHWTMIIDRGTCTVHEEATANPDATVSMSAADFVGINTGTVNPAESFWSGRINIEGSVDTVLALPPIMDWSS